MKRIGEKMSCWKFVDVIVKSFAAVSWVGCVANCQEIIEHALVHLFFDIHLPESFDLRGKDKCFFVVKKIKRFLSKTVAGSKKCFFFIVPNGKSKSAVEMR